jgi:uncharacterized damage-inducible protein DinB
LRINAADVESALLSQFSSRMSTSNPQDLLPALLDSWDRNNTIVINLLRALPEDALKLRPMQSSPSIGELFAHIHYVRLVFVSEDAPEFARPVPDEWVQVPDRDRMIEMLNDSAQAVREAVQSRVETGRQMDLHYDHPILLFQHMIWHEGYHHGQIKLTLKLAGQPLANQDIGPLTWRVWMNKTT